MQLSYRGCQYQKQTVALTQNNQSAQRKYRGVSYILEQGKLHVQNISAQLKYRGVTYQARINVSNFVASSEVPVKTPFNTDMVFVQ